MFHVVVGINMKIIQLNFLDESALIDEMSTHGNDNTHSVCMSYYYFDRNI